MNHTPRNRAFAWKRPVSASHLLTRQLLIGRLLLAALLPLAWSGLVGKAVYAGDAAEIYAEQCASCHGADGQGVADEYDKPLYGDMTVAELAKLIEQTMPEGEPEMCIDEDAQAVATYIFDRFYSQQARERQGLTQAIRVELARLTVAQHRNALADLVGHFTPDPSPARRRGKAESGQDAQPGLNAQYYQSKGMSKADRLGEERIDDRIDFDFGEASPTGSIAADQFAIIWEGALLARHSGEYQFRVRTQNGVRLYLNNDQVTNRGKLRDDSSVKGQSALIDGWVSSGKTRELTARVDLLGGRQYPLRLEFFKYKEKNAAVQLEWKPPHGTWSVLDKRHLSTARVPRTFVATTPFPSDDRSLGYERGSSASAQWYAATANAALETATEVVNRLPLLSRSYDDADRAAAMRRFVCDFASIAFRRPLTDEEVQYYSQIPFQPTDNKSTDNKSTGKKSTDAKKSTENQEAAIRRAVLLVLQSPHFLYTDLTPSGEVPDQHAIAARMALTLWDSIPDQGLRDAADQGQLADAAQITEQARRMLADPRTRAKMRGFFQQWLELEDHDLAKDQDKYPEFNATVVADLRQSLEHFVEQVVWSDSSDYRELLLADYLWLNGPLARLYASDAEGGDAEGGDAEGGDAEVRDAEGGDAEGGDAEVRDAEGGDAEERDAGAGELEAGSDEFTRIATTGQQRAGLLTHPYLLSAFAYHNNTSPIHRGVFLTRNVVGRDLKPPPIAVAFKDDEFAPDLTMREKVTQLTRDQACMSCHAVINPLGFALEHYDAVGRWRESDNHQPIDAHSDYPTSAGETVHFQSARDIAQFAVQSELAQRAFVAELFHHFVKQDPHGYSPALLDRLRSEFAADQFSVQDLLVRITVRTAVNGTTQPTQDKTQP